MEKCNKEEERKEWIYSEVVFYLNVYFPFENFNREEMKKKGNSPEKVRAIEAGKFLNEKGEGYKDFFCNHYCDEKCSLRKNLKKYSFVR